MGLVAGLAVVGPMTSTALGNKLYVPTATGSLVAGLSDQTITVSIQNTSTVGNITAKAIRVMVPPEIAADLTAGEIQRGERGAATSTISYVPEGDTFSGGRPFILVVNAELKRNNFFDIDIDVDLACSDGGTVTWDTDVRQSNDFNPGNVSNLLEQNGPDPETEILPCRRSTAECRPGDSNTLCSTGQLTGSDGSTGVVTIPDGDDDIFADLIGEFTTTVLDCPGFNFEYGNTLEFSATSPPGNTSLEGKMKDVTVTKAAIYGTDAEDLWKYQVCFEAPYAFPSLPFIEVDGVVNYEQSIMQVLSAITAGDPLPLAQETSLGSGIYRGILLPCALVGPTDPCLVDRTVVGDTVTTLGRVKATDPKWL